MGVEARAEPVLVMGLLYEGEERDYQMVEGAEAEGEVVGLGLLPVVKEGVVALATVVEALQQQNFSSGSVL